MKTSRRNLLLGAAGAVVAGGIVLSTGPVRRSICGSPEELYRRESLARLGEACVACRALTQDQVERQWAALARLNAREARARIADDFAAGRVASVDGWHLADTEVMLFAADHFGLRTNFGQG